jgi:excisionase family DNA binding protein
MHACEPQRMRRPIGALPAIPPITPLLVGKKDAARLLGLCLRTVENLIKNGKLPAKRIGRRVLINRECLERFARETNPVWLLHDE